jgi:hypothetical protein
MAELFSVNLPAICKHLKNIFVFKSLAPNSVISKMKTKSVIVKKIKIRNNLEFYMVMNSTF